MIISTSSLDRSVIKRIVTPEQFKAAFLSIFSLLQSEQAILSQWNNPAEYSQLTLGTRENKGLLHRVADNLRFHCFREYFTIDAIFFEKKDEKYFSSNSMCAEYLCVAVEHENDARHSHVEINKLCIFNTPLKVLITYPNPEHGDELLSEYADIIQRADIFNDFSTMRKQMVIFGGRNTAKAIWSFHVYNNGFFVQL